MSILKEFQDFAMKGNVVDLAVGVIMGAAFGPIVSSLVEKVIMPPIGLALGGVDFSGYKWILKAGDAANKDDRKSHSDSRRLKILNRQASHLSEIAHR